MKRNIQACDPDAVVFGPGKDVAVQRVVEAPVGIPVGFLVTSIGGYP